MFILIYRLRELPLSRVANRFDLRCHLKQLLLLYYKICPWCNKHEEIDPIVSSALLAVSLIAQASVQRATVVEL